MTELDEDETPGVWVTSDVNPDGSASYIVTVSASDDVALSLRADAAVAYVAAVTRAAVTARHDAAVVRQLTTTLDLPMPEAARVITDLRSDREPINDAATAPLRFEPIVSGKTLKPWVHLWAGDKQIGQWTPTDCLEHAGYVMEVLAGVDLDSAYYQYLVHTVGVPPDTARGAVHGLGPQDGAGEDQG